MERITLDASVGPLRAALQTFLSAIEGEPVSYPDAELGTRIVEIAERALPGPRKSKPRVGVIGGGIFGAACALEFAPHADVILFERHPDLMTEASFQNQWRFHSGFHYPRSPQTVQEIQSTREDFCSAFGEAVIDDVVSYYCTSNQAAEITGERYLAICTQNKLRFEIEQTPPRYVDSSRIDLCLRTDESVFDFYKLRDMARERLREFPNVEMLLNTEVVHGEMDRHGRKILTARAPDSSRRDEFDYLVNTTYANSNIIAGWFNFPVRRLRFDFCEMVVLEIPMPNVSLTVLDGPFCSLVSTGHNRTFILTHIHESVLKSRITPDGLPPAWGEIQTNRLNLIQSCARYFPIVKEARFLESRYGVRTVEAFTEDYDGRPTVVTDHGFGCWSVLGGKISTCVSNAREIVDRLFPGENRESERRRGTAAAHQ
jgi:glycine/D-amino acid oxidase-like deaminating enzyme